MISGRNGLNPNTSPTYSRLIPENWKKRFFTQSILKKKMMKISTS